MVAGGCASTTAPSGYLDLPDEARHEAYGGWVTVEYRMPPDEHRLERNRTGVVHGELIAITPDSLYVLRPAGDPGSRGTAWAVGNDRSNRPPAPVDTIFVLGRNQIDRVRLMGYDAPSAGLALWTTGGTLSTISHGFGLVISAPFWLISGIIMMGTYTHTPELKYPDKDWARLGPFARYPQGWPQGLDRNSISARR